LLIALKLDPVRILIADDVGIGKTVEACILNALVINCDETGSRVEDPLAARSQHAGTHCYSIHPNAVPMLWMRWGSCPFTPESPGTTA